MPNHLVLSSFLGKFFHHVANLRTNSSSCSALLAFSALARCFASLTAPTHAAFFVGTEQRTNFVQLHIIFFNAAITAEALLMRLVE